MQIACYKSTKPDRRKWQSVYIRLDALDWFLSYAADQHINKGVIDPAMDDKEKKGNCAAVADLYIEYDFIDKSWVAEFIAGEHLGVRKRFALALFSKQP